VRDNNIRVYIPAGFDIAKKATSRSDLQLRMQGNSFLGAFFRVSPFLQQHHITEEQFQSTVRKQYQKKFGRFGDDVVTSNMTVMTEGFSRVQEIIYGQYDDPDRSSMRNPPDKRWAPVAYPDGWLRLGLWNRPAHACATDAALRLPDFGQV